MPQQSVWLREWERYGYYLSVSENAQAQEVVLRLGSDDRVVCWLNGREVQRSDALRALQPAQDQAPARLEAGVNRLLLCVSNGGGEWAMSLRITGPAGQPVALER